MSKKKNKNKNKKSRFTVLNGKFTKNTETKTVNTEIKTVKTETKTETNTETKKYIYCSTTKNYDYMGRMNKTNFPEFVDLCKPKQMELKKILENKLLDSGYTDIIVGNGYIYAKGTVPILLTAHMDTVHKQPVKDFYEYYDEEKKQHIISSPQGIGGDDRCGIYMILELIKTHKCSVVFCEDEEIGGVGSKKFCETEFPSDLSNLNYLIELDRKGNNDAVFYDCENYDFMDFIEKNTGYRENYGSFSDISNLSPACKVASVNLSCGYYNAHTTSEYVVVEEMLNTIEVVRKLLDVECEQFEYIESEYIYRDYNYGYSYNKGSENKTKVSNSWDYNDDDDYLEGYQIGYQEGYSYGLGNRINNSEKSLVIYVKNSEKNTTLSYIANGKTEEEAFGKFFIKNPTYCYHDISDYDFYESKLRDDGWFLDL